MHILFSGTQALAYRDPACIFTDGKYYLFMTVSEKRGHYMHNRIGLTCSEDLIHWIYKGHMDGGENACIILKGGEYHLFHSPKNGIGHKISRDLVS